MACVSNLPRKRRIYATEEQLSGRYRALDAIVRHLYPDEDLDSDEAVESLARRIGADISGSPGALADGPLGGAAYPSVSALNPRLDRVDEGDRPDPRSLPHSAYRDIGPSGSYAAAASVPTSFTRTSQADDAFPVNEDNQYTSHDRGAPYPSRGDRRARQSPTERECKHESP